MPRFHGTNEHCPSWGRDAPIRLRRRYPLPAGIFFDRALTRYSRLFPIIIVVALQATSFNNQPQAPPPWRGFFSRTDRDQCGAPPDALAVCHSDSFPDYWPRSRGAFFIAGLSRGNSRCLISAAATGCRTRPKELRESF